jgi:hypothetical protein
MFARFPVDDKMAWMFSQLLYLDCHSCAASVFAAQAIPNMSEIAASARASEIETGLPLCDVLPEGSFSGPCETTVLKAAAFCLQACPQMPPDNKLNWSQDAAPKILDAVMRQVAVDYAPTNPGDRTKFFVVPLPSLQEGRKHTLLPYLVFGWNGYGGNLERCSTQ